MDLDKEYIKEHIKPIPTDIEDINASCLLTKKAVDTAIDRHVGFIKRKYAGGKNFVAYGKDLSEVKYIIGTGGALTRLPKGKELLENKILKG